MGTLFQSDEGEMWCPQCVFCSFPVPSQQNQTVVEDERNKKNWRKPRRSLQPEPEASRKRILLKYLLAGCEDNQLRETLYSSCFNLQLCDICQTRAVDIENLNLELEVIQMKLMEKLKELRKLIIANSRKGPEEHYYEGGNSVKSSHIVFQFHKFVRENGGGQLQIPLLYLNKLDDPVDRSTPAVSPIPEGCPNEEMDVDQCKNVGKLDTGFSFNANISEESSSCKETKKITPRKSRNKRKPKAVKNSGKGTKVYECEHCSEFQSTSRGSILIHLLRKHNTPEKPFQCSQCPTKFSVKQALALHLQQRHKDFRYKNKCDLCRVEAKSEKCWKKHLSTAHPDQPQFQCDLCGEIYLNYSKLMDHSRRHRCKLACALCEEKEKAPPMTLYDELPRHLDEVHGISDLRLKCDFPHCGKVLYCERNMRQHKFKYHQPSFHCKECLQDFSSYLTFHKHNTDVHLKNKQMKKCNLCQENVREYSLLRHKILVHGHPRPHCDLCPPPGTYFMNMWNLKCHQRTHHPQENGERFKCSQCPKEFLTRVRLADHENTHATTRNFACDQCGVGMKTKKDLKGHLSSVHATSKDLCCEICGFATANRHSLRIHVKKHDPQIECPQCGKMFSTERDLRRHNSAHSEEKKFQCHLCGDSFKHKMNLKRHQGKKHQGEGLSETVINEDEGHANSSDVLKVEGQQSTDMSKK